MKQQDRPVVETTIREMMQQDPHPLNVQMAVEASKRTGSLITNKDISKIRGEIGLGNFHIMSKRMLQELSGMAKISPETSEYNLKDLTLLLAVHCVRNTVIENYHAQGKLSGAEMEKFNIEVSNKLYTALNLLLNPVFEKEKNLYFNNFFVRGSYPTNWNEPVLDKEMMNFLKHLNSKESSKHTN